MSTLREDFIKDLEKFRNKFPFPFTSEKENDDFLLTYKYTIEQIQFFCEQELDYFRLNTLNVKSIFENIYRKVSKVIENKLKDDDETAIHHFNELMKKYKKKDEDLSSNANEYNGKMSFDEFQCLDLKDFFRIRPAIWENEKIKLLTKEDLFHIKFNERRKCKNYRFSISGIPALYLGDSIELCEKEIFYDKDISQYYVSQFRNRDNFKVITIDFPELAIWGLKNGHPGTVALRFFAYLPF